MAAVDDPYRRLGDAEMTSTISSSEYHMEASDPPTLQIRDRRGVRYGQDDSLGRTPSPVTSMTSIESEVTPGMRMELRQKRRIIEEVAVYDSRTFYEDQSPKRSRHRDDALPSSAAVRVEHAPVVEHHVVEPSPATVHVQPELSTSTSVAAEQTSRTFAVTGSIQVPEDIEKVDVPERQAAVVVVTCVAATMERPPDTVDVTRDSGGDSTSVTYVVHHAVPGKMASGDVRIRSNDVPYRDLRTDLAETPSMDIRKKGKAKSRDYGPVLETVTYVVCYQDPDGDESCRNVINELHRPNYRITGRVGPTSSIEDTAESYTMTGVSGGPPPYSEEQESLYLAILNYAARSQDNLQREVPGRVTYITQQDFPKAIDSSTLSLSRKGPTVEARESSPPPTPTRDDDDDDVVWVKQKFVVVEPAQAEVEVPTSTTADVFSDAMDIVHQAEADADVSPPTMRTEYRGWRKDDEVEVKRPAADVVLPRYQVDVYAEASADEHVERFISTEASPADEVVVTTSVSCPSYPPADAELYVGEQPAKSSAQFTYQAADETPEVHGFPDAEITTTRAYVFHEQLPTVDVKLSGMEPLTSEVDVATTPVSAYVEVTAAGSDTFSRTYVVHRDWPSLKAPPSGSVNLDAGGRYGSLAEALGAVASGDISTNTYVVHYDWPTATKPTVVSGAEEEAEESIAIQHQTASFHEEVPHMFVVHQRESPSPQTTPRHTAAAHVEKDIGIPAADAAHEAETPTIELPENLVSHVYIVRRDWPKLSVPQPNVGQDVSIRLGTPSNISPAPTGDMTTGTYVVHYDWPITKADLSERQKIAGVPTGVTEPAEVKITTTAAAAAPPTDAEALAPKPRVTFAPTVVETNLDLVSPSAVDVDTVPKITHEVQYDLPPEHTIEPSTALTAAAVDVEPVVIRVPHISVVAEGPAHYDWPFPKAKAPAAGPSARITIEEPARGAEVSVRDKTDVEVGEPSQKVVFHYDVPAVEVQEPELIQAGGVDTTYDSDMERDWPWFKADSPAVRQKPTVSEIPLIPVAVEVIPGGDSEGPPRELTSQTYIVRRDWPELKLVVSRPPSDIGLSGALTSDTYRRDITTKTYIVNYEWPLAKPKPKDSTADTAAEPGAFTSAEDDSEMSPTYLARIERSRVKIHLPGPDRSREAEVEVIPPDADDEQTVPSPPSENSVTRTYIVHHDWPRVRLLLSEPKPNITDDDLFTSRQMDSVTYIVHYDWPSRKATVPVEEPREIFTEEMPSTNVELLARYGTDKEFDAAVDLSPPTAQELPAVRVRPPEPRRIEFEQPVVEVVAIKEPEVRLRLETDIDEVLGRGTEDVVVQHDLPPMKIEQPERIHIRQPAIAGLPRIPEPMIDHSIRLETDIDLPDVEPAASVSAAVDVPSPVTHIEADREKDIEPVAVCVLAPSGDVVTRTYIVQHDWPKVKLTLSERKRKLDTGLQIEPDVEADRQLISRTYIVQYDWPSLKAKAPPAGPTARITIEEPDSGAEVAMQRKTDIEVSEPSQKVVFHYDVPTVEVQEPEPIRVREPSIEVIAMAGTDITDVDVGAAAAGPTVMLAGEDTPSAELTSHTYIVHRDWPRVQLILPEPKRVLAAAGVGTDGASGTVERKTYIVHYDWPTKGKKVISIKASSEVIEQPGPPAIAVERTEVVSPTVPETSGRDEHVEPAAVTVVAPSGDVITHTYIVHHDWPGVKLTLSEPKRLDAGSRIVPGVDADRQLVSRTYVVHYDWPPLTVKTTQPTEPSARIVVEEQVTVRGKPETGDATVSEPLPSVTVQYDVPIVEIQEPEPINIAEPTVKMITEPIPEPKISTVVPLYAETDIDVDVTVGEPVPNVVVQHDFVPTVQIDEVEPNLFPEAAVQTIIAEPKPQVDLRLRYETDIDLAIAEASAPSAATAADIPVAITYVDKGKDEAPEPRITIVAPSGDVVTRTYIVHHDWPRVKLTLSEPKRKLDTGLQVESQVESDRQLISRTYIVNYDWPSLKAKAPAAAPSARITIEEPARGSEVPVRGITDVEMGEPSQKVVFHYDIPTVEVQEPEPIQVREPSIEVIAMASTDVTDVDVGAAAAGPTVMLAGEATPSAELTSHTYIVHRDWPRVQLVLPEPKRVLAAAGVGTDGASGTVERKTYVVHYDWPTKGKKVVSIKAQSEVSEQPGPPAIEVERTEVVSPTLPETSAVTIVTPSADVTTHIYVVHHDWPTVKLTLSEPRRRLDTGPQIEPGAEADGQLVSRTYVVHYDWPSLKVKATQPIGPSARIVTEEPESGAEVVVHGEPEIDVDATVSEPLPSVVVQYDVSEVKIREPEPIPVLEPSVKVIAEPQPEPETVVEVPAGSGVGIDVDVTYRKLVVQPDFVPSIQIQEAEPDWLSEPAVETVAEPQPEIDIRLRYESDVDLPVVEPAVPPDVGVAVPLAVTYVDEGKDKFAEPTITVIAPSEDVETHTYIVHHKWPKVKLTLSEPKAKLGVSPETEEGVAAPSSKVISLTYIVNWPSMKGKPDKHVPEVTAEIEIEKPTAVQVAEPASVEVRVDEERRPSPVPVAKVELTEIEIKGAITTRDVPEIAVTVPAAAAAPGAVTYVDDHVEPTIAIVAPSENVDKHIYIVHHDWPTVRLTLPEPKRKLDVSGLADVEEGISAPSGKVISLTYVVNWPSMKAKPEKHVPHTAADIEVQAPTILSAEPAAIEVGVDEEPKPSHDAEAEMPEVEAKAAAITAPDVSISAVTVTDEDKIAVPAAVSISVAAGEEVLCTYVVHHDWPRVKLIVPEPKRPLAPGAGEDVDVDKISRTYLVHYDWPVLQITGYPTPFREEVPEVPAPEMPSTEFEAETVAEGRGIPVQKQISETVNVDYDVVQITPPAVIVEGGFEAPEVARPAPYEERPRPEIAEAVAVGASVSEPESDVIRIREADEIEFPGISIEKEITVIQPSIEVERRGEVEVAEYPAVEGVQEAEKLAPSADVSVEVEKPDVEISIQPSDVHTPKTTKELRIVAPAPEIETEVPTVEKVPEEETVTFIVHYEEPTIGARMSPTDDVRISFRKKQRAGSDEVRILLRPIHEPVAAGDVTTASGLPSLPHHAVVAIDIGTTFSGYAFSITTKTRGKDAEDEDGRPRQQQQQRTSKVGVIHSLIRVRQSSIYTICVLSL